MTELPWVRMRMWDMRPVARAGDDRGAPGAPRREGPLADGVDKSWRETVRMVGEMKAEASLTVGCGSSPLQAAVHSPYQEGK